MTLSENDEAKILEALRSQPFGGMFRTAAIGLCHLVCVEIYVGELVKVQRRKVDELDNVTVTRIRK